MKRMLETAKEIISNEPLLPYFLALLVVMIVLEAVLIVEISSDERAEKKALDQRVSDLEGRLELHERRCHD